MMNLKKRKNSVVRDVELDLIDPNEITQSNIFRRNRRNRNRSNFLFCQPLTFNSFVPSRYIDVTHLHTYSSQHTLTTTNRASVSFFRSYSRLPIFFSRSIKSIRVSCADHLHSTTDDKNVLRKKVRLISVAILRMSSLVDGSNMRPVRNYGVIFAQYLRTVTVALMTVIMTVIRNRWPRLPLYPTVSFHV